MAVVKGVAMGILCFKACSCDNQATAANSDTALSDGESILNKVNKTTIKTNNFVLHNRVFIQSNAEYGKDSVAFTKCISLVLFLTD